jgi:hypothetical protein
MRLHLLNLPFFVPHLHFLLPFLLVFLDDNSSARNNKNNVKQSWRPKHNTKYVQLVAEKTENEFFYSVNKI